MLIIIIAQSSFKSADLHQDAVTVLAIIICYEYLLFRKEEVYETIHDSTIHTSNNPMHLWPADV